MKNQHPVVVAAVIVIGLSSRQKGGSSCTGRGACPKPGSPTLLTTGAGGRLVEAAAVICSWVWRRSIATRIPTPSTTWKPTAAATTTTTSSSSSIAASSCRSRLPPRRACVRIARRVGNPDKDADKYDGKQPCRRVRPTLAITKPITSTTTTALGKLWMLLFAQRRERDGVLDAATAP
ncbi:hypothetical protein NQ176_g9464 [Zarea fungicola]|uniref:Uncharacterized protein n=1 Tax=Zarea fungicola TaxID=93591 RepID=A0ACC1MMG0_9HYPO|nr:hypothetical protein NQ176_g9464 [Lecanicillium fungicola]